MICIVGAGLTGLTLAQYLKKHNIDFIILENKQPRISNIRGYSLTLMQAVNILKELNLFNDLTDTVITTKSYGYSSDGTPLWCRDSWSDKTIVRRSELLRVLAQGITITNFDYDHYESHDDRVVVYDKNGHKLECDYLVGCDGLHSKVHTQLIGHNHVESCENIILINGITKSSINASYQYVDGVSRLFIKPFDQNHAMWQLTIPEKFYPKDHLSVHELSKFIVHDWILTIRDFISKANYVAARPLLQHTYIPSLPRGRVTLMGDSAHTMSPFKGLGANTAMMDAKDFINCIVGSTNMIESIQKYNTIMLERGNRNRLNSTLDTKFAHSKAVLKTPWTFNECTPHTTHLHINEEFDFSTLSTNLGELVIDIPLLKIPSEVFSLKSLKILRIVRNKLTTVPDDIGNLTELRELHLRNNQITYVSDEISKLIKLKVIRLSSNQLTELPLGFGKLLNLTDVCLSNNKITNLTDICLSNNKITNLTDICLSNNKITESSQIRKGKLRLFYCSNNPLNEESVILLKSLKSQGVDVRYTEP